MKFLATKRAAILGCLFLLALASCGGGGGDNPDNSGALVATFTADCPKTDTCFTDSVSLEEGTSNGAFFEVDVFLNKLATVIGVVDLTISFDPALVSFQGSTPNGSLGNPPETTYLVTPTSNQIEVSITFQGGRTFSTSTNLITLSFKALKTGGASSIAFVTPNTKDVTALLNANAIPGVIQGVTWNSGKVTVN